MTDLLQLAFAEAGKLLPAEQDLLASRILAELTDDTLAEHPAGDQGTGQAAST